MKNRTHPNGFTLIELSIVLVIIGLITGGILTGRDLIHAAALRSQIKQLQDFQTAFNTFVVKYNCIPGDCANATTFFGTTDPQGNTINNGNGNGSIDTSTGTCFDDGVPCGFGTWNASTEMWGAIQQLSLAHLMSFTPSTTTSFQVGTGVPPVSINTSSGLFLGASYNFTVSSGGRNPDISSYQNGSNAIWMVACNATSQTLGIWDNNCSIFTASDLLAMDKKMDDGLPLSGKLIGFGGYSTNNDCLNISGSASTYKITNNTAQCQATYVIN